MKIIGATPTKPSAGPADTMTMRASREAVVPPSERPTLDTGLDAMSQKEMRRGGDYGFGAAANDVTTGFLKGLALIPDAVLNPLIAQHNKYNKTQWNKDLIKRSLAAGNYEEVDWLVPGLIGKAKAGQEELGTGSKTGNVIERTGEFAALAVPFASALNAMAKASKVTKAQAGLQASAGGRPVSSLVQSPSGRAVGEFAPTTTRGKLGDMVLAPYRANPTNAWGLGGAGNVEMMFGALSGAGAGIEQEVFDGSGMTGALLAPLAAGLAIPTTKAVLTRGPIGYIGRKIAGATTGAADDLRTLKQIDAEGGIGSGTSVVARQEGSAGARQKVGEILNKINDSPDAASNQEFIRRVGEEFGDIMNDPDLPLSMAQILGDPRLIAQTRAVLRASGEDALVEQEKITRQILERLNEHYNSKMKVQIGTPTELNPNETASFVLDRINGDMNATLTGLTDEAGEIQTSISTLLKGLSQEERAGLGQNIRQDLIAARQAAFAGAEEIAEREGLNAIDQLNSRASFDEFSSRMRDAFLPALKEESLTYQNLPSTIREIIDRGETGFTLSFKDWKNYREKITAELSDLYARGDAGGARNLKVFAEAWDDFGSKGNIGQSKNKFDEFMEYYKTNVAGPLENNIIVGTLRTAGGVGDNVIYQTMPENVAGAYLNSVDGLSTFMRVFGQDGISPNPSQVQNLRKAMYDKATAAVYRGDGSLKKESLDAFINDNNAVLRELGMLDEFKQAGDNFMNNLSQRLADVNARKDAINNSRVFKLINDQTNYDDVVSPSSLFERLFQVQNRDEVREIARLAKQAGVEKEFNTLALENVMKQVYRSNDDFSTNPEQLLKWINNKRNRQLLDNALGTEHSNRIQLLAEFGDRVNSVLRLRDGSLDWDKYSGTGIKTFLDRIAESVGTSVPQMTTRFITVQEGRLSPRTALAYLAARAVNSGSSARYEAVMAEALTNPVFARELMKEITTGPPTGLNPRAEKLVNDFYFQRGITNELPEEIAAETFRRTRVPATGMALDSPEEATETIETSVEEIQPPPPAMGTPDTFNFERPSFPPVDQMPFNAPTPQQFAQTPPAPTGIAATQQQPQPTANFQELFPFDTTGQAINRRRSGIGGLGVV